MIKIDFILKKKMIYNIYRYKNRDGKTTCSGSD